MRKIKLILAVFAVMLSAGMMAQDVKPVFEQEGELIKGTFYYEDGSISQEGTYKDGKLHGEWISYGQDGKKTAIAKYSEGNKIGKWFFWDDDVLKEVEYNNNQIAQVSVYKSTGTLVIRD